MPSYIKHRSQLFCRPKAHTFLTDDVQRLERHLAHTERHTTAHPITDEAELLLDDDNKTQRGGYRYTARSFRQISAHLARGLCNLLLDVSGDLPRAGIGSELLDIRQSRRIFNDMVGLRFGLLGKHRLLRNEQDKTIDGLVSHQHKFLDNRALLDAATDGVLSHKPDVGFYAASVISRRAAFWYRSREPLFKLDVDGRLWPFHYGYYFHNSETIGMSVRGGVVIYTPQGTCMAPMSRESMVKHIGKDFNARMNRMLQYTLETDLRTDELQEGAMRLLRTPLGYAGLDQQGRQNYEKRLKYAFRDAGVTRSLSYDYLDDALYVGRNAKRPSRMIRAERLFATRAFFDLFCSVVRLARRLPATQRELSEQAAHKMLTGNFTMTGL